MEVVDSPLNLAHQQSRKADRMLAAGKYEDAISCHGKAAELLREAMKLTECEQAGLSMALQRDSHVKQQRLIEEKWKRTRQEGKPMVLQSHPSTDQPHGLVTDEPPRHPEREYDTWLYLLKNKGSPPPPTPCPGSKAHKDDKTRLEEQQTTIVNLRRHIDHLLGENEKLSRDNQRLRGENVRLKRDAADTDLLEKSELWVLPQSEERKNKDISIPNLPPLEMPTQDISLDDLPALELPEDIQHELQALLDRDDKL
ncbi:nuclear receptor-binding factor 2 isoform X1 [Salmo salar]|uniref:Nuclear receptor-binding factor 2 isoform X1 n=1 Tax=Salmo salar TaxID=8030 RepID=A0A1S3T675_SALSA|nr:nuclear receptor-binding factor 2-like isoform X1 [Salmo salar]|eukprot:XP_014072095.1 PREDICTED: nuclear receptor-binding factor 2-like isoform X1 [Salmo salar]